MFVPPSPLPPTPSGFFPHKSVGSSLAKVTMTRGAQRRVCLLVRPASSPGCTYSPLELPPPPGLETAHSLPLHGPLFLCLPALSSRPPSLGTLVNEGGLASGLLPPQPRGGKRFLRTDFSLRSLFFVLRSQRPETGIILDLPSAGDQPASTSRHLSLQPGPDSSPSPLSPPLLLLVGTFPQPPHYLRFHRLPL